MINKVASKDLKDNIREWETNLDIVQIYSFKHDYKQQDEHLKFYGRLECERLSYWP